MADDSLSPAGLIRLQTWLSPAFPVGGFSYSHGLESAVDAALVADGDSLRRWLCALIGFGSGWNDAVLFAEAGGVRRQAATSTNLPCSAQHLRDRANAMPNRHCRAGHFARPRPAAGRMQSSSNCLQTAPMPLPSALRRARMACRSRPALAVFLQAFAANLAQAAIRLGVTGQSGAVSVVAAL